MRYFSFLVFALILIVINSCEKDSVTETKNKPPEISILAPRGDTFFKGDSVTFYFNVSDEDGKIVKVEYFIEGRLINTDVTEPFDYKYFCDKVGLHNYALRTYDDKGLSADANNSFSVTDLFYVTLSLFPNYYFSENSDIMLTAESSPSSGGTLFVEFYIDENLVGIDSTFPFIFIWKSIPAGLHSAYAKAVDRAGRIGLSSNIPFQVNTNQLPTVNFTTPKPDSPGFVPGQDISFELDANDSYGKIDSVEVFANNTLIATLTETYKFKWLNVPSGEYVISAKAYDNSGAVGVAEPLTVSVLKGIGVNSVITKLVATEKDNLVFGLDISNNKLLFIDPESQLITSMSPPSSQAIDIEYSKADKKLYILYKYSGIISVWDNVNQSFSMIEFSGLADGIEIKVDELNRRLYVLASSGIFIIDMDNSTVLLNDYPVNGNTIAIDPVNRSLFSTTENGWNIPLTRYSITNDMILFMQSIPIQGYVPGKLAINVSKEYIILPHSNDSYSSDNELLAYSTKNLSNIVGGFTIAATPVYSVFGSSGNKLFATSTAKYGNYCTVYVMNADTFLEEKSLPFPNSGEFARMCTNNSETKLIAFSYYENYGYNAIYFIDL
jgi:hypothetical protein